MKYTVKLKENKDFVSLFKRGRFVCDKMCVVYFRKNGRGVNRLGISTGKKTGNAVVRSRCRRIIRQAYYENEELFPKGYDYIFVSRAFTGKCKSTDLSRFIQKRLIREITSAKPANNNGKPNNKNTERKKNS